MKYILIIICLVCMCCNSMCFGRLLNIGDFTYIGAFRVPKGALGGDDTRYQTMALGGDGASYNPANNSLVIFGRIGDTDNKIVEISIPTPVISQTISSLPTSTVIQNPANLAQGMWHKLDITDGQPDYMNQSNYDSGGRPGGLLIYGSKVYGTSYSYYTTEEHGFLSHFSADLNWTATGSPYNFSGFKQLGPGFLGVGDANSGLVAGYMCLVPTEWREALGVPALTGQGAIAVNQRTSSGPAIFGFDPDNVDTYSITQEIPYTSFVAYPSAMSYETLGTYTYGSLYYGMGTKIAAIAWPNGTDTILISQRSGRGYGGTGAWEGCYGTGTSDINLHSTFVNGVDGEKYCYDPAQSDHGGHSYPYFNQLLAYDANDLLAVKNGTKNYWEPIPYTRIELDLPYAENQPIKDLGGMAYDPTTKRLFIVQKSTEYVDGVSDPFPIIHVYQVNTGGLTGKRYRYLSISQN